jgi:cullin 1
MYTLLARIPEGLEPLRKKFEAHVKRAGLAAVEKLASGKGAAESAEGAAEEEEEASSKAAIVSFLPVAPLMLENRSTDVPLHV